MRKSILLTLFFFNFFFSTYAQQAGKIAGHVRGTAEKAVDFTGATISLLRAKDSVAVKISVANNLNLDHFFSLHFGFAESLAAIGFEGAGLNFAFEV